MTTVNANSFIGPNQGNANGYIPDTTIESGKVDADFLQVKNDLDYHLAVLQNIFSKLDTIQTGATVDQTAADIVSLINASLLKIDADNLSDLVAKLTDVAASVESHRTTTTEGSMHPETSIRNTGLTYSNTPAGLITSCANLLDEIKNIRYQIHRINGKASWTDTPDASVATLKSAGDTNAANLSTHIADNSKHLTMNQNAAIDGANNPSASNVFITQNDVSGFGFGDMLKSVYDSNNDGSVSKADSLKYGEVFKTYADILTKITNDIAAHSAISNAHHARYTDAEARAAINNDANHGSSAQHNYFTAAQARAACTGQIDAATLNGFSASQLGSNVSDNGTLVVSKATDINFADPIKATNDGDGTITVSLVQGVGSGLDAGTVAGRSVLNIPGYAKIRTMASTSFPFYTNENFGVGSLDTMIRGMCYNPTTKQFCVIGSMTNVLYRYDADMVYTDTNYAISQDVDPRGICYNAVAQKFVMVGGYNKQLYDYDNNFANIGGYSVSAQDTVPVGIEYLPSNNCYYLIGQNTKKVYEYSSTFTYTGDSWSISVDTLPQDICYNPANNMFYIIGRSTGKIYEFTTDFVYTGNSLSINLLDSSPMGLTYSKDTQTMYMSADGNDKVFKFDTRMYTQFATDDYTILFDATKGDIDCIIPAASASVNKLYNFKRMDNGNYAVVVMPTGDDMVDNFDVLNMKRQYECITIHSDGTKWVII